MKTRDARILSSSSNSVVVAISRAFLTLLAACMLSIGAPALADDGDKTDKADVKASAGSWTGGGKQFWSDYFIGNNWRIQRNVYTGHYRLLDENNRRRTWGTFGHCRRKFEASRDDQQALMWKKQVVVTLHGMGRTRESMTGIGEYVAEQCGCSVVNLSYASTRDRIESHARALASVVKHLEGVEKVHFVAHSMGNLVVRRYLAMRERNDSKARGLPAVGRIVMLAPPNQGSSFAKRLRDNELFRLVGGVGGAEFAERWDEVEKDLLTPQGEFGIIAGGGRRPGLKSPVLDGDNDVVVTVEETKLDGADDFRVVPVIHTFIMDDERVRNYTENFLKHGYFVSEAERKRLPMIDDTEGVTETNTEKEAGIKSEPSKASRPSSSGALAR